jgi:AbrB family looped-hinge helix DNA binding protein
MCRRVPITVEVDERGRLTIPEAAREALGVTAGDPIVFDVEVLSPDDAAGSTAVDVTQTLGDRGRITIKPSSVRDELGIRDRVSICSLEIESLTDSVSDL